MAMMRSMFRWLALAMVLSMVVVPGWAQSSSSATGKVLFILLDGCRADIFHRLCDEGKTPTFAWMRKNGLSVDHAVSVFPSTTGPAYAPFLCGTYPYQSNLTGIRQYLRNSGTYRSYCGTDVKKITEDLSRNHPTIFELLPNDSLAVVAMLDRGAKRSFNPSIDYFIKSYRGKYLECDRSIFKKLQKEIADGLPRYTFVSFHGPDSVGHRSGADGVTYDETIINLDRIVNELVHKLKARGELEQTTIILSADHGSQSTDKSGDLAPVLAGMGLKVQDAIGRSTFGYNFDKNGHARENDVIVCVSGNACVQVYLKGRPETDPDAEPSFKTRPTLTQMRRYQRGKDSREVGDVIATLLKQPCVGFLAVRNGRNSYQVLSREGTGLITRDNDRLGYKVIAGSDPLKMSAQARQNSDGRLIQERKWLRMTCADPYPDAVFQIAQLLEAENSGDILINAAPGYEPWHEGQKGVHGGIDAAQLKVPLVLYGRGITPGRLPCARTVDVYVTILNLLDIEHPRGLLGVPLLEQ
ncbi:MAG TPA: alkaline phosphatase family protein [Candidatus Ozemobacteraceae bacterium]|nr:alkaline phosphatase family protein [Candidatus Ozemobacteraceae bacterium]